MGKREESMRSIQGQLGNIFTKKSAVLDDNLKTNFDGNPNNYKQDVSDDYSRMPKEQIAEVASAPKPVSAQTQELGKKLYSNPYDFSKIKLGNNISNSGIQEKVPRPPMPENKMKPGKSSDGLPSF